MSFLGLNKSDKLKWIEEEGVLGSVFPCSNKGFPKKLNPVIFLASLV